MSPQIVVILLILAILIGMVVWYFTGKNELVRIHNRNILKLENAIFNNRNQLNFRNSNLSRYDFQKYNLDDALVIQPEIIIERYFNE